MAGSWQVINGRRFYLGDNGPETAIGTAEPETLSGKAGDDALNGDAGNDAMDGGHGNDTVQGGDGDDQLWDGSDLSGGGVGTIGHDSLDGGNGNDTLRFFSPDTGDFANGGAGHDLLEVRFNHNGLVLPGNPPITFSLLPGGSGVIRLNGINTVGVNNIERIFIVGNTGNDVFNGGAFDDSLVGLGGDDVLRGHGGDDLLESGTGQVNMDGGEGTDRASFDLSGATTGILLRSGVVIGLSGFGVIREVEILTGFKLGSGSDRVELDQLASASFTTGAGNDTVTSTGAVSVELGQGNDVATLGAGADFVDPGLGADLIRLGGGDDRLDYTSTASRAGTDPDTVFGEDGNDAIYTPAGTDSLDGGNGNDTLYAGGGADRVLGGAGNDSIEGEGGADVLRGGEGNDRIGADYDYWTATSPADNDLVLGEAGNDYLLGGIGADTLDGGLGDDTIEASWRAAGPGVPVDPGLDRLNGGAGNDTLKLGGLSGADTVTASVRIAGTTHVVIGGDTVLSATGMEALDAALFGAAGAGHTLIGGALADVMRTGNGNDYLSGGEGADTIGDASYRGAETLLGGGGNDRIQVILDKGDRVLGGDGDDLVQATGLYLGDVLPGANATRLDGGLGFDTLALHAGGRGLIFDGARIFIEGVMIGTVANFEAFTFFGSAADDRMIGTPGNDAYALNTGADTASGGEGADSLDGAAGNDLLNGDGGADTLSGGLGANTLSGGLGDDLLTLGADTLGDVVNGGGGLDTLIASFTGSAAVAMVGALPGSVAFTQGGATLIAASGVDAVSLAGAGGADSLDGGSQADTLDGGAGNDLLRGGGGADVLVSNNGQGADTLDGGAGADLARLSRFGATVDLVLSIGAGSQTLADGTVLIGIEQIALNAGSGNDTLRGGALNDSLSGAAGGDSLLGGGGDDSLEAGFGVGADTLLGGAGNDSIASSTAGAHRLDGEGGSADLIVFSRFAAPAPFLFEIGAAGAQTFAGGETVAGFERGQIGGGAFADTLLGAALSDTLNGSDGADLLAGGEGNDVLGGDGGADSLAGGGGADSLAGGTENDTMLGGAGADLFRFFQIATNGVDRIEDFGPEDAMTVLRSGFSNLLTAGVAPALVSGADPLATASAPSFLHDTDTGDLLFDADGTGTGAAMLFVRLLNAGAPATLDAAQIIVV
jgi:Ca2+-binding RTX toxin-like protein